MAGNLEEMASFRGTNFLLLPHELALVHRDYEALARVQQQHGELLGEAMGQSSETYHDNAPAEAVIDAQTVLMRRVQPLQRIFRNHTVVDYPEEDSALAALGSTVEVSINSGEAFGVQIVGYLDKSFDDDDIEQANYDSALGVALLGEMAGDVIEADIHGSKHQLEIIRVDQRRVVQHYAPLLIDKALRHLAGHKVSW